MARTREAITQDGIVVPPAAPPWEVISYLDDVPVAYINRRDGRIVSIVRREAGVEG